MASAIPANRVCRSCNDTKPLTAEFWCPQKGYEHGFTPHCRECTNKRNKERKRQQRAARGAKPRRTPRVIDGITYWECATSGCGWHPESEFYRANGGRNPSSYCKPCYVAKTNERYHRDPEYRQRTKRRAKQLAEQRDPEGSARRATKRAQREERAARGVRLCPGCDQEHPFEEFQPTAKRPRGIRSRCRPCRREANVVSRKAGWERDPERYRGHVQARNARIRGAPVSDLTVQEWQQIRLAYDNRCAFCGRLCTLGGPARPDKLTKEHDIPVSRNGWHSASNVYPACFSCNSRKKDRTAEEFAAATGLVLNREPHPFKQPHLGLVLPPPDRRKPFPIPDGWNRLLLACDDCRESNEPLCDVCRRRVKRWQEGKNVRKRAPRYAPDGTELHFCTDPDCEVGWQPMDAFYPDNRGGVRSRCKKCVNRRKVERNRERAKR